MRWPSAALVVFALLLAVAPLPSEAVEQWYSQGAYARLQPIVTGVSSLLPVALLDLAAIILVAVMAVAAVRGWRRRAAVPFARRALFSTLVLAAVLYLWFLAFWGLNYRRVPLERRLVYDSSRLSRAEALKLAQYTVDRVNALALASRGGGQDDAAMAAGFADVQRALGASRLTRIARPKLSGLTWYFRKAGIDGMTDPFFLEIIVASDLLPFERPHTLAHEWAHLAGHADEAEANFVAWLACVRAAPLAQYSGWLSAYQYVNRVLPGEDRRTLRAALSPAVLEDLEAIRQRLARASPAVSSAARGAYDTYLRANRVDEGIANYGLVVRLMLGSRFDGQWLPELRSSQTR